jgi:hypothetical protein
VSFAASQRLEPEGIAFIGSTYPDVRHGLVFLDPQGESIEVDLVVSLGHSGRFDVISAPISHGTTALPVDRKQWSRPKEWSTRDERAASELVQAL